MQWVRADRLNLHSRGEDLRWKVGDVGGDRPARQELSHLVGESVAVVLKQAIPVTSEQNKQQKVQLNVSILLWNHSWSCITAYGTLLI